MATVMMAYPARDTFQEYPQQYAMYQSRASHSHVDVTQASHVNPYSGYTPAQESHQCVHMQQRPVQTSPAAAGEECTRPSLPSISNLLGIADGDRVGAEAATQQIQVQGQALVSYPLQSAQSVGNDQKQQLVYPPHDYSTSQRSVIPPTPPLRNDSVLDGTHSPSTISTGSSLSIAQAQAQPYLMASALNNVDAVDQRTAVAQHFMKRHSIPSQPSTSPYGNYSASPYVHSPGAASTGSYYSPTNSGQLHSQALYHQRPLPSNFPPQSVHSHPLHHPSSPPRVLEHHHYIHPSQQSQFPQSQDRYICPTCNKAFSRPSSLKIHSHSHTGEKPFKCPHGGCGKAFSVRSNMKRHERGHLGHLG